MKREKMIDKRPETVRNCYVCKRKHTSSEVGAWPNMWHEKKINGKKIYWCRLGIDCSGCGFLHKSEGSSRVTSEGAFCDKWFNSSPSLKSKLSNLSPEEVVSGGLHGMPNQFAGHSEDYTKTVKQQQRRDVLKALK